MKESYSLVREAIRTRNVLQLHLNILHAENFRNFLMMKKQDTKDFKKINIKSCGGKKTISVLVSWTYFYLLYLIFS